MIPAQGTHGIHHPIHLPNGHGMVISVDTIGEDHLVVEYADNVKEACLFRFEDGDSFWIGESDIDMMIQKVFREIESSSPD